MCLKRLNVLHVLIEYLHSIQSSVNIFNRVIFLNVENDTILKNTTQKNPKKNTTFGVLFSL